MSEDIRGYSSSQSSGQVPNRLNFCLRSGRIFRTTRLFGACLQREAPHGISGMLPSDAVRLLRNTGFASTCLRRRQTTDGRKPVPVARKAYRYESSPGDGTGTAQQRMLPAETQGTVSRTADVLKAKRFK